MPSLLKLEECKLTPERIAERDWYLKELESNNAEIRKPSKRFWEVVRQFLQETSLPQTQFLCDCEDLHKRIEENTDFMVGQGRDSPFVDCHINPWFVPDDITVNHLNLDKEDYQQLIRWSGLRTEIKDRLLSLEKRNSELLVHLCKIDLEGRLGADFRGIYAHAGLDVDLPYKLDGEWLIVEPNWQRMSGNYKEDVISGTEFGRKALAEGRIRLTDSPILQEIKVEPDFEGRGNDGTEIFLSGEVRRVPINPERLDSIIANYVPDVVLIKVPTPGAEYKELWAFYESFLKRDTLIVVDDELQSPNLKKVTNITGVNGLTSLKTEKILYGGGGSICPFLKFRMYILQSNVKE